MDGRRVSTLIVRALPLAAILLLAVELRLLFRTGMVHIDSLVYAHLASDLVEGAWRFTAEGLPRWVTARVGLYGPAALFYALFGPGGVTTFAWPFICSLFGIVCAYGIGRKLAGEAAGLVAAFLWTVLPTDVAAATALLGDGPIAALSMGVVFFLLVAESARGLKLVAALVASAGCLLLGLANKPAILLLFAFFLAYLIWRRPKNRLVWFGLAGAITAGVVGYGYYSWSPGVYGRFHGWQGLAPTLKTLAGAATDWWSHLVMGAPEFSWITPLWIVAVAALLALRRRQAYVPLLWFGSMFLYLEVGTRSLSSYTPISTLGMGPALTRHFLLVAAPATIATGIYLAQGLRPATWRWLIPAVAAAVGVVAWVGTRHVANLSWDVTGEAAADLPFATLSAIAIAVVVFVGVISPLFVTGQASRRKSVAMAVLLLAIGFGSLNLSYQAANRFTFPWVTSFREAVQYLEKEPPLPIFVQNDVFGLQLDYASRFQFGFAWQPQAKTPNARIHVAPTDPDLIGDAYVLVEDFLVATDYDRTPGYLKDPPASWAEVAKFGDHKGYQLRVYHAARAVPADVLEVAARAAKAEETPRTLRRLLEVATNAREYCLAARTWARLRVIDAPSMREFNPVKILGACYAASPEIGGPNLFYNAGFARGFDGWTLVPAPTVDVELTRLPPDADQVVHVTARTADQRAIILQGLELQPETAYGFEATLMSTMPIVALYWASDVARFESEGTFKDWTTRRYVFVTPRWDGKPRYVDCIPFLLKEPGAVWLKNVKLVPLQLGTAK